jgi:hypothetical protein
MINIETYTKALQRFLQMNIIIKCEGKTLKAGRLKLFSTKQYFIRLNIETPKKETKILELPYPYDMCLTDTSCTLNYRLSVLTNGNNTTTSKLRTLKTNMSHKVYDNLVTITGVDS